MIICEKCCFAVYDIAEMYTRSVWDVWRYNQKGWNAQHPKSSDTMETNFLLKERFILRMKYGNLIVMFPFKCNLFQLPLSGH